ncbi:uncharacterized protein LOC121738033 [Aricia agestis]|uniref:uncharacterized protein LOC121738033 n=1 Tax=Aricia agestis TaxID=91739 RepID=UPI001C20A2E9|nr:uncharacterized protein LOC121738033 [Aricia agestis]
MLLIFLLQFLAVQCKIHVQIVPQSKHQDATVVAFGSEMALVSDLEIETFRLTDSEIKCRLSIADISPPDYVHVKRASYYGYRDIYTILKPTAAKVIGFKKKTVVMYFKELINNSSVPASFKMGLREDIVERMSVRWSANEDISVGRDLNINFSNRMNYVTSWDTEEKEMKARTMSATSDVELTLQPGQNATITMQAIRARLDVSIEYAAMLAGDIYCQYAIFFIPFSGRVFDVNEYLNMMRLPSVIVGTQYVYVDYNYGGQVIVEDDSGALMMKPIEVV